MDEINENMTVRQYARKHKITLFKVYRLILRGKVKVKKIGKVLLIPVNKV